MERLDRVISQAGFGSRSVSRKIIRKGRVKVNHIVVRDPSFHIKNQFDTIWVDDQPVDRRVAIHVMLNKPEGCVTARQDSRLPTIMDWIDPFYLHKGLVPVGRLDRDTTGLLLLTNDGQLNHRLTSPRWTIWKTYRVTYEGEPLSEKEVARFSEGLAADSGTPYLPARLVLNQENLALLSIQEGQFHQVKRMFKAVDRTVTHLHRVSVGPLKLDETLEAGAFRELKQDEITSLYRAVSLDIPN